MISSLDTLAALSALGTELTGEHLDAPTGTGPIAYAACVALCTWWMDPPCLVACIPLFFTPVP